MSEQLNKILWMTEELDFSMDKSSADKASQNLQDFLESAANTELSHTPYPATGYWHQFAK